MRKDSKLTAEFVYWDPLDSVLWTLKNETNKTIDAFFKGSNRTNLDLVIYAKNLVPGKNYSINVKVNTTDGAEGNLTLNTSTHTLPAVKLLSDVS